MVVEQTEDEVITDYEEERVKRKQKREQTVKDKIRERVTKTKHTIPAFPDQSIHVNIKG
jgi:hypothetical protein